MDSKILKSPIPTLPYPKGNVNAIQYLLDNLSLNEDKEVMVDCPSGRTWSAKQVIDHILDVAAAFISRGLKKGDVVCFVSPNSDYYAMILYGVIAAGGIFTASHDKCPFREVANAVEDTGAIFMVTDLTNLDVVKKVGEKVDSKIREIFVISDNEFLDEGKLVSCDKLFHYDRSQCQIKLPVEVNPNDFAAYLLTSGSTGRPKVVIRTHSNTINASAQAKHQEYLPFNETSIHSCNSPLSLGGGLNFTYHALAAGAKAAIIPGFGNEQFLNYVQKYKITSAFVVPAHANYLANCDASKYDLSSLEEMLCGGSALPLGLAEKVINNLKLKIFRQGFGMTEVNYVSSVWRSKYTEHPFNSIGWCAPGVMAKIVDRKSGQTLGPNETGELLINSLQMTPGYLNLPEENAKLFDDEGFLRTGDAAYYDENKLLYIADRYKQIINVDSLSVYPTELESLLIQHPAIYEAAVIGIEDQTHGEIPKAFVVLKDGHKHVKPDDIIEYIKNLVAPYKQLRGGVEIMNEFPKTSLGKINKKLLLK